MDDDQKMQAAKKLEELEANNEDMDMDSEEREHQVDLIVMQPSEKSIGSSENYYIIQEESKEEPITGVPHIDFIFKDQQWIFEDCDRGYEATIEASNG